MRLFSLIAIVGMLVLSACSSPQPERSAPTALPTQTEIPATATPMPLTATSIPQGKLPAAPFDAQVYINDVAGFALDYPASWTVNEMVVGSRGTQVQFLSKPELAEAATIPEGETRVSATIYQWDPKNDLPAYVQHMKEAWSASGSTILDAQELTLEQGLPAELFTVQAPDEQLVVLVTALKDQYLVIAGEGNLDLAKQMLQRLRPISN
jgi:hypothetical protein